MLRLAALLPVAVLLSGCVTHGVPTPIHPYTKSFSVDGDREAVFDAALRASHARSKKTGLPHPFPGRWSTTAYLGIRMSPGQNCCTALKCRCIATMKPKYFVCVKFDI